MVETIRRGERGLSAATAGAVLLIQAIREALPLERAKIKDFDYSSPEYRTFKDLHQRFMDNYAIVEQNSYIRKHFPEINMYTLRALMFEDVGILEKVASLGRKVSGRLNGVQELTEEDLELRTRLVKVGITDVETAFVNEAVFWESSQQLD